MYCLHSNPAAMALKDRELEQKGWQGGGEEIFMDSLASRNWQIYLLHHYHWMQKLPLWASVDDFILVHAGLNFNRTGSARG